MGRRFEPLFKLIEFFRSLKADQIVFDILQGDNDVKVEILDLNRIDQLFNQGIDSKNRLIGLYSISTEIISKGRKKAGTHFTLFDTGKFYESFKLIPFKGFFEIVADGQKDNVNLFDKYGTELTGLTPESIAKLPDILRPKIIEYIRFRLP